MKELQYKQLKYKTLDVDKSKVKVALANFTDIDKVGDLIDKHAFDDTLKENSRKWFFINHNPDLFIKRFDEMYVTDIHLIGIADLNIENQNAKDILTAYQANEINEHSIGYFVEEEELIIDNNVDSTVFDYDSGAMVRGYNLLKKINLWEGSALTIPAANPNTPFLGFKTLSNQQIQELIIKQYKSIEISFNQRDLKRSDLRMIEYKYLQLKKLVNQLLKSEPCKAVKAKMEEAIIIDKTQDLKQFYNFLTK